MNKTQKISVISGVVFGILWFLSAKENGFEFFDEDYWEYGFDEWHLMLWFALAVGSFVAYKVFGK